MFLIYFISYGCNDSALVFLGGAEASASPSFALPMFITIKKIIILHLFLGVPAATVGGTGTPWHTRGYAPGCNPACGFSKTLYCLGCCSCIGSHADKWLRNSTTLPHGGAAGSQHPLLQLWPVQQRHPLADNHTAAYLLIDIFSIVSKVDMWTE